MAKQDKYVLSAVIALLGLFILFIIAGSLATPYEPTHPKTDVDLLMHDLELAHQQVAAAKGDVVIKNDRVVFDPVSLYESPKLW